MVCKVYFSNLRLRYIILALLLAFIWRNASGQRYNFSTYAISDGLPNNQINKVIQDRSGKLWIATMNGVCSFDGKTFTKLDQTNVLSNNNVKTIFEDKDGNIWLGTVRKGLCKFDGTRFTFYTTNDGLLSDIVNAICQDNLGNLWIGTSEGLNKFDGKEFTSYTTTKGLINNNIFSLLKIIKEKYGLPLLAGFRALTENFLLTILQKMDW